MHLRALMALLLLTLLLTACGGGGGDSAEEENEGPCRVFVSTDNHFINEDGSTEPFRPTGCINNHEDTPE